MSYLYLFFAVLLYFPLIFADKMGSAGTEERTMLFKYSFYKSVIGVVAGGIIMLINGSHFSIDLYTLLTALMFGLMLGTCMLVTLYSMQVTTVAISSMFKAASVIIPCLFGAMFFGDTISVLNVIGFLLFLGSIYLIVSKNGEKQTKFGMKAALACLGVLVTNGLGSVSMQLFGELAEGGDEAVFMFISYCVQTVILFVIYRAYLAKQKSDTPPLKISGKLWIYGIIGTVAAFLIQQIMAGLASQVSALIIFPATMGSSVIIGVLTGWLFFKEKLTVKSVAGIAGGIISILMINMF